MAKMANEKTILNLTMHSMTDEQQEQGVFEPYIEDKAGIRSLLTVNKHHSSSDLANKAMELAFIVNRYNPVAVMVGGKLGLMMLLVPLLKEKYRVVEAFSERVSQETTTPDGEIVKVSKFVHVKFDEL